MNIKKVFTSLLVSALLLLISCTAIRFVPAGEKLYTGASIQIKASSTKTDKKIVLKTARLSLQPKPNYVFLWMRPKLWLYSIVGDSTKTRFGAWIRTTLGEPPVLVSTVDFDKTERQIDTDLYNIGYFKSVTSHTVQEQKKTARAQYTCDVHSPYTIREIVFNLPDTLLQAGIDSSRTSSLLKPGDTYSLETIKKERERIEAVLKDRGYFYFSTDYILVKTVVLEQEKTIDLEVCLKEHSPAKALTPYRIGTVYIDPNYTSQPDSTQAGGNTSIVDSVVFIKTPKIGPKTILRSIFIKKDDLYSRTQQAITLNRLMTNGNFKYAEITFTEGPTSGTSILDARILLTPAAKRMFSSELMFVNKSNDFMGPRLNVGYQEKSAFGGGELLNVSLNSSIETKFIRAYNNLYSFEIDPHVELDFPWLLVPFSALQPSGFFIPKTKFAVGYSFTRRINFFDLKTFQLTYGYTWKEDIRKEHELNPANVTITAISNPSNSFTNRLDSIPFLKSSYQEQFIAGALYSFTYNEQVTPDKKNQFYIKLTGESAGNALWLGQKIFTGKSGLTSSPQNIAGLRYSQFVRVTFDARDYVNFPDKSILALRLYTGVGKPYGNSSTLPYIRQFFSGGASSVRAFPTNTLGPGTSQNNRSSGSPFLEVGGDIKLEANAEYRFNIVSILKGAVFVDAGNNWQYSQDTLLGTEPFSVGSFYKELGVGTGIGLRIDASFFILRCDLAIPLRKPWLNEHERWVLSAINVGQNTWRQDNLIINIALGYPF